MRKVLKKCERGIQLFLFFLLRSSLALRYKVTTHGLKEIQQKIVEDQKNNIGTIFFPNHPAYVDPLILICILWPKFNTRPAMIEEFYDNQNFNIFLRWVQAIPVPDFTYPKNLNRESAYREVEKIIVDGIQHGETFMFYPSGRLKRQAMERLEGCSGAHRLASTTHNKNIVMVRTSGLWGSRFSCAYTKNTPDFLGGIIGAFWDVCKSLVVFTPRRPVTIEFEFADKQIESIPERLPFNQHLQSWYNQKVEEMSIIKRNLWASQLPQPYARSLRTAKFEKDYVPEEIIDRVVEALQKYAKNPQNISADAELGDDLGLDSIELAHIISICSKHREFEDFCTLELKYVGDIFLLLAGKIEEIGKS